MGFFKRIFNRNSELTEAIDYGLLHTDMHSHLIPGIDDGSRSMKDTLQMLESLAELGFKKIITTPHILSDLYPNSKENILAGYHQVLHAIQEHGLDIEFGVAAEYFLDDHFIELIERDELLTFGDNYLLFELSFAQEPLNLDKIIFDLQLAGYTPVLAHPERYSYWHNDISKFKKLFQKDVILQVNINSLAGYYSPQVQKMAEQLIDANMVRLLGTDLHNAGQLDILHLSAKSKHLKQLLDSGLLLNSQL